MKKAFSFTFQAKSEKEVDIHIFGVIGSNESWWGDGTNNKAYALVSLIKRLDKQYDRINVHINSPGGSVWDGLAIYNALNAAKADIHTHNAGFVGSMASIIMLAGTTHFPKTSVYHLHSAITGTQGNIQDHERAIEALKAHQDALIPAVVSRTGLSTEEVTAKWFDGKDYYMSGTAAQELGFVDVLEEEEVEPPVDKTELENMNYKDVMNLYNPEQEDEKPPGLVNQLKRVKNAITNQFNNNDNEKSNQMANTLKFKAKLTVLLALIGFQEFALNADNKVEISIDDAYKINDSLEAKDAEIANLTGEKETLTHEVDDLKTQITNLQAELDGKPAGEPANPKGGDTTKGKQKDTIDDLDDETSKALREYNKAQGIIK